MKTFATALLMTATIIPCNHGRLYAAEVRAGAGDQRVIAENDLVRLVFDKSKDGNLAEFVCKTLQRNLLSDDSDDRDLYRIVAVDAQGHSLTLSGSRAKESNVTSRAGIVTIKHRFEAPTTFSVTLTCELEKDSARSYWRIRVENESQLTIRKIIFPVIEVPDSAPYVLFPYCDGWLVQKPGETYRVGYEASCWYPGSASAQLMAAGLGSPGGLYYAAHDALGYKKQFTLARDKQGLTLATVQFPVDGPGNDYRQPFDIVLSPFLGTWHSAADIYKAWAVKQPWCARKVADRPDIPQWLKNAPMCLTVGLRRTAKKRGDVQAEFDSVRKHAKSYANRLRRPSCVLLGGWQGKGYYVSPHYFPPFGGNERFTRLTSGLIADGNKSIVFLCGGVFWTLEKSPPIIDKPYDDWQCFQREGEPHAVIGPDGKTLLSGVPDKRIGKHAYLCLADPYTHKTMLDICEQIPKLGVTVTQLEMVGGGQPICYSTGHGHPPGGGNHQTRGAYRLLESILKQGRKQNKDYALAIEEPGEFFIPVLSCYHARDNSELRWPRSGPSVRGVPLFTYLYHEYAVGYLGQGSWPATKERGRNRHSELWHALNFVRGKMLALSEWSGTVDPEQLEENQLRMIDGISAAMHGLPCKYLMTGRMLHPVELECPRTRIKLWNSRNKETTEFDYPAVLQGVFEYPPGGPGVAPDEKTGYGVALANVGQGRTEFRATLAPLCPNVTYSIRQHGKGEPQEIGTLAGKPCRLPLALEPCESTFVEVTPR